jgi:hypothetical protein
MTRKREEKMTVPHNFVISAIRYDNERNYIEKVKAHEFLGKDGLGAPRTIDRMMVIGLLLGGNRLYTLDRDQTMHWKRGSDVHKVYEQEKIFISTDPTEKMSDNLGNLPEF